MYQHQPRQSSRGGRIALAVVLGPIVAVLIAAVVIAAQGPDRTPAEEQFLAHQDSTLSEDEALRDGHAICGMLDAGGRTMTIEWLAGVDDFSRAGMVEPNPDPVSMFDARQVVEAADTYLCT